MDAHRSKAEPLGADFDLSYFRESLSNIPIGFSCLYIAPEGSCLDQLPPKEKGGPLTQLEESYEAVVASRIGKRNINTESQTKWIMLLMSLYYSQRKTLNI